MLWLKKRKEKKKIGNDVYVHSHAVKLNWKKLRKHKKTEATQIIGKKLKKIGLDLINM